VAVTVSLDSVPYLRGWGALLPRGMLSLRMPDATRLMARLRLAQLLEIGIEERRIRLPLQGAGDAFDDLSTCIDELARALRAAPPAMQVSSAG
jgi:hypothetical protein